MAKIDTKFGSYCPIGESRLKEISTWAGIQANMARELLDLHQRTDSKIQNIIGILEDKATEWEEEMEDPIRKFQASEKTKLDYKISAETARYLLELIKPKQK